MNPFLGIWHVQTGHSVLDSSAAAERNQTTCQNEDFELVPTHPTSPTSPTTPGIIDEKEGIPFGDYRLVKRIGTGGMARLYLAHSRASEEGFSRPCVVKRVAAEFIGKENFQQMLAREARVMALLDHPYIVQVFDFGNVGGDYYIAMEWVNGPSLAQLLDRAAEEKRHLGPRAVVLVGTAMCEALGYAHNLQNPDSLDAIGVLHRDVCPSNILLSHSGAIKLADFGIAKLDDHNSDLTRPGTIKGKFAYLAPERLRGMPASVLTDVFSLGVVLWELAAGRPLFKGAGEVETIAAVQNCDVPAPSSVVKTFPKELSGIILRALEKDPSDRYQNVSELHDALEAYKGDQPWTSSTRSMGLVVDHFFPDGVSIKYKPLTSLDITQSEAVPPTSEIEVLEDDLVHSFLDEHGVTLGLIALATVLFWIAVLVFG